MASAGTIKNSSSSDTTGTTVITTESICPKGWTLPAKKQADAIGGANPGTDTYVSVFSPVLGGAYGNGLLQDETTLGHWWTDTANKTPLRNALRYKDGNLFTSQLTRYSGAYIRCVSEEKDVSDLTYMQDMTPSILQELCVIVNVLRA